MLKQYWGGLSEKKKKPDWTLHWEREKEGKGEDNRGKKVKNGGEREEQDRRKRMTNVQEDG